MQNHAYGNAQRVLLTDFLSHTQKNIGHETIGILRSSIIFKNYDDQECPYSPLLLSFSALSIELVKNYVGYVYTRVVSCRAASDSADSASRIQGYMTITSERDKSRRRRSLLSNAR